MLVLQVKLSKLGVLVTALQQHLRSAAGVCLTEIALLANARYWLPANVC